MASLNGSVSIEYNENRPCIVDNNLAIFHRLCDEDKVYVEVQGTYDYDLMNHLIYRAEKEYIIQPPITSINKARTTFAVVEFEDGTIKKVDPEKVKFLDGKERFKEIAEKYVMKQGGLEN